MSDQSLKDPRRFIFHGEAAAFGGRIVRPVDTVLECRASSSLAVTGGRSQAKVVKPRLGKYVRIAAAASFAEGLFDSLEQTIEVSHGRRSAYGLSSTTRVNAEVRDLVVGVKPQLTVKRIRGSLTATNPGTTNEPGIKLEADSVFEKVRIGGHTLIVEPDTDLFGRYDTRAALLAASAGPAFGHYLFPTTSTDGRSIAPFAQLREECGECQTTFGTIVKPIRWENKPYPGSRIIDGYAVAIPDFGTVFFGEILITGRSRRLTMMRLKLGSPVGGDVALCSVQDNGSWS